MGGAPEAALPFYRAQGRPARHRAPKRSNIAAPMDAPSELLPDPLPGGAAGGGRRVAGGGLRRAAQPNPNAMVLATSERRRAALRARGAVQGHRAAAGLPRVLHQLPLDEGQAAEGQPARRRRHALGRAAPPGAGRGPDRLRARRRQRRATSPRAPGRSASAAWASAQSEPVDSRAALLESVADTAARFGTPVPGAPGADERVRPRGAAPAALGRLSPVGGERWSCGSRAMRASTTARAGRATLARAQRRLLQERSLVGDAAAALSPPAARARPVWKTLRVSVLLLVLAIVARAAVARPHPHAELAGHAVGGRLPAQRRRLAARRSTTSTRLTPKEFTDIETFFAREGASLRARPRAAGARRAVPAGHAAAAGAAAAAPARSASPGGA